MKITKTEIGKIYHPVQYYDIIINTSLKTVKWPRWKAEIKWVLATS